MNKEASLKEHEEKSAPGGTRWLRGLAVLCSALSAIAASPQAIDRGQLTALAGDTPISVTIMLALPALDEAEKLQQALYTPGDPQFHKFLTADQFVARFAPSNAEIERIIAALARYGLAAEKTTATTLRVSGLPADMERAFLVSLHHYEIAPRENSPGYSYHAPLSRPTIPPEIAASVAVVAGLDNRPVAHPHLQTVPPFQRPESPGVPLNAAGNPLGLLTVKDFASQYDVEPLYSKGVTGSGRTIGIVTLAAFTASDAYKYWQAVGLKVASNRIQIVNVDGGPGLPSDALGSLETALDVEQAGGVAPGARIIVYQASNNIQAWVDAFAAVVDANVADSFSTSWGNWEWGFANTQGYPAVVDPITGRTVTSIEAFHELFLRAAIQGQSAFAASGDGGGYTVVNDLGCRVPYSASVAGSCSATLTVDYPASDPLMTAGGGTTLPGQLQFCLNAACTPPYYDINIPHERMWGWDYLEGLCKTLGYSDPVSCGIFPWGSGGGVSIEFAKPLYQFGLNGIELSQPGQAFFLQPYGLVDALPANYAGRNVPDVSFNADPETGYIVYYTSDVHGFQIRENIGGTSAVAPQLNGVAALLGQYLNQRVGLLHIPLYLLALTGEAYRGPNPPLHAIAYGDNWFYHGTTGYNLGAGLGTLDVANFANILRDPFSVLSGLSATSTTPVQ